MTWTVGDGEAGVRLDRFLAAAERFGSRSRAATALDRGKVFLNGAEATRADAGVLLRAGDEVRIWVDRPGSSKPRPRAPEGDLRIVYEDDVLLVIDKPAGLLTVPLPLRERAPSAYDLVETYLRQKKPLVVHRIDRDTSGLIVYAKTARAQLELKDQFRRREPERVYLAVVYGHPHPAEGTWRDRLIWDGDALIQKRTHARDPKGKDAVSHYRVVESFADASLVEVRLETGKRNQIRLQARLRGHTLVGEKRYVFGPDAIRPIAFPRQALHAWRLAFRHPADGRRLDFEAPLPSDLETLIAALRGVRR